MEGLVTSAMIRLVSDSIAEDNIRRIDMRGTHSFRVGRCVITRSPAGDVSVHLDDDYDRVYGMQWKTDVGQVLKKELRKDEPELYELENPRFRVLLKKVSPDEAESFGSRGFIHVTLGDDRYTIIRIVKPEYSYTSRDYEIYEEPEVTVTDEDVPDAIEEVQKSVELF